MLKNEGVVVVVAIRRQREQSFVSVFLSSKDPQLLICAQITCAITLITRPLKQQLKNEGRHE